MSTDHCEDCRYYLALLDAEGRPLPQGDCRRYPPQMAHQPERTFLAKFPEVKADWSCGEYALKITHQ